MNSTHWVVFLPHTSKVDHLFFSVFFSLIIMYDDIVVQSQTNELITRDTNRELVLETHSNAVGKICYSQFIAISFQSKRLDCWADILCWKRGGSILGFKKLKFFSSSFSLNDGGARISWGFVLVSLCFDDNMSHAGRQQAWLSFPRWWLQTMESSREVIIKTLIKFKNIHLKVCLWGHLGHVRYG